MDRIVFNIKTFITPDGAELRYGILSQDQPDAPTGRVMVYVPGLGGSVKYALPMLKRLAATHGPVYSLDGRGMGINDHVSPQVLPGKYCTDLNDFVAFLQQSGQITNDQTPILLGLSLGGVFVTHYLHRFPQHPFKAVVMFAPAFQPNRNRFNANYRLKNYWALFKGGLGATCMMPYTAKDLTRNIEVYDDPPFSDPVPIPILYLHLVDFLCRGAIRLVKKITTPTAVIVPDSDTICDPGAMIAAYNRIPAPNKMLLRYDNLYHDVLQEPDEDLALIDADLQHWLNGFLPATACGSAGVFVS